MSWSVSKDGTRDEVTKKIADESTVPQGMKDALVPLLAEFSIEKTLSVTTYGHHNGRGGGNATIMVTTTS